MPIPSHRVRVHKKGELKKKVLNMEIGGEPLDFDTRETLASAYQCMRGAGFKSVMRKICENEKIIYRIWRKA